jgi:hypothetical protein
MLQCLYDGMNEVNYVGTVTQYCQLHKGTMGHQDCDPWTVEPLTQTTK